jgi:hypothetical protein
MYSVCHSCLLLYYFKCWQTLTIEVDVSTTFYDLAYKVFVLTDVMSLTGCDNLGGGNSVVFKV